MPYFLTILTIFFLYFYKIKLSIKYLKSSSSANFTQVYLASNAETVISSIRPTDALIREKFRFFYRNADHFEICSRISVVNLTRNSLLKFIIPNFDHHFILAEIYL